MNLKIVGYLQHPPWLEKMLRFDHCICLEKSLLKLLGVNCPFLIVSPPFRNLPPFLDEILLPPPFSAFSNFSTTPFKKGRGWNYVSTSLSLPLSSVSTGNNLLGGCFSLICAEGIYQFWLASIHPTLNLAAHWFHYLKSCWTLQA